VQGKVAEIIAIQREDVEGVERDLVVVATAVQPIEIGDPVNAKQQGFAITNELFGPDAPGRLDD